jgi:4-diphosphocytidyl-2C-methyl-D-erythritol kinase
VVRKHYPEVDKALNWLEKTVTSTHFENGQCSGNKMTGTGACVFVQCQNEASATQLMELISKDENTKSWNSFLAAGLNRSPVHEQLENIIAGA